MAMNERMNFDRIMCPIDLTSESERSLRYGIALSKAYDATLFVSNCVSDDAATNVRERARIRGLIDEAVRTHLRPPASADFRWNSVLLDGDPHVAIVREAAREGIELIIMNSRRRPYAAALIGSTAELVCRIAPCPVMVTHPLENEFAGATTNAIDLKRVLVAYDFSIDSELALSYGLSLAQEFQSELHLLHVLPSGASAMRPPGTTFVSNGENRFFEAARQLRDAVTEDTRIWCEVKHAIREGRPYREVLSYAEDQAIDLICMGASGSGFGMQALFGSNADRVLRQSPCPVLIARPLKPALATLTA